LENNFAAADSKERPFCFSAVVANLRVIEQIKKTIATIRDVDRRARD
jgi:hypothetical protein